MSVWRGSSETTLCLGEEHMSPAGSVKVWTGCTFEIECQPRISIVVKVKSKQSWQCRTLKLYALIHTCITLTKHTKNLSKKKNKIPRNAAAKCWSKSSYIPHMYMHVVMCHWTNWMVWSKNVVSCCPDSVTWMWSSVWSFGQFKCSQSNMVRSTFWSCLQ